MQPINSGSPSRQNLMPSRNLATKPSEGSRRQSKQSIKQQLAASRSSRVDMQESEGGQAPALQTLDVDNKVRTEVNLGIHQIRTIEQQLRTAPQGFLDRPDISEAQALRMTLLTASATIIGSFSKITRWLSAYPPNSNSFLYDNRLGSDRIGKADSPLLSTSHTHDSDAPHSPRPRVVAAAASSRQQVINPSSPVISPCHTAHSGSGMSEDSATPASPPVVSDADGDAAAAAGTTVAGASRARRPVNEATPSADPEVTKQKSPSVKRKFMPKFNCKQRASDPGHDGPPDDGHTWRKYGQKDILGSRNPRSYYRCTHKIELGCPATKYVQRCDDEPMLVDVTYRGSHTCQSIHQQIPAWPFSGFPEQMGIALNRVHQLPPSDPMCSAAMVSYPSLGGNHPNSSAAQSQVGSSDEILLGGNIHGFSQLASGSPMGVGVPSSTGILDISRFPLNPAPSMELGVHQQDFPVKPEDNNPSQSTVFDVSRLPRDSMFGTPDLLNMLLANSRSGQNDISFALAEEDLQSELKRVKLQHHPMEPARSTSDNSGQMGKSAESQYGARWGAELDVDYQLQLEEQIPCRYGSNSPIISGSGQSRPTSAERGHIASMKESDDSGETRVSLLISPGFTTDEMMEFDQFPGGEVFF